MIEKNHMPDCVATLNMLCKQGRLFEVQKWLKQNRPPNESIEVGKRNDPLVIAIERGFHSLAEVLLKGGFIISEAAMSLAVSKKRIDIVRLLFDFEATAHMIPFWEVVYASDREMIHLFIAQGADFKTNWPLAEGLYRVPKLFCGIYKAYINEHPDLKMQAEIALRKFCSENKMRGVCLMLWLGADPRVEVPE